MNHKIIYFPGVRLKQAAAETTTASPPENRWTQKTTGFEIPPVKRLDRVELMYNTLDRFLTRFYPLILFFGFIYLVFHIFLQLLRSILT